MKKIPTLFEREFDERGRIKRVLETPKPGFEWVFDGEGVATEKVDGACCAIIGGKFYKRFDAKEDDTQEVCDECAYDVIIADKSAKSGIASVCVCGLMNRAADAIEELQEDKAALNGTVSNLIEQIAELSKPRWIPVEERLPKEGVSVQVCFRSQGGIAQAVSERFVNDRNQSYWSGLCGMKPTHWMPLPQAPKEE